MQEDIDQFAKYRLLQEKLSTLQYNLPFGADSCALVEKLLNDVLKSVENFEILAKRYDEKAKKYYELTEQLSSYKKNNFNLKEENNCLKSFPVLVNNNKSSTAHGSELLPSIDVPNFVETYSSQITLLTVSKFTLNIIGDLDINVIQNLQQRVAVLEVELRLKEEECEELVYEMNNQFGNSSNESDGHELDRHELNGHELNTSSYLESSELLAETKKSNNDTTISTVKSPCTQYNSSDDLNDSGVNTKNKLLNQQNFFKLTEFKHSFLKKKNSVINVENPQITNNVEYENWKRKYFIMNKALLAEKRKNSHYKSQLEHLENELLKQTDNLEHFQKLYKRSQNRKNIISKYTVRNSQHADTDTTSIQAIPLPTPLDHLKKSVLLRSKALCNEQDSSFKVIVPLPNLLNRYFKNISPIRPEFPPNKIQYHLNISKHNKILSVSKLLSLCIQPSNTILSRSDKSLEESNDFVTKTKIQLKELKSKIIEYEESLQIATQIKKQLKNNLELQEDSFKTIKESYDKKIFQLTHNLENSKRQIDSCYESSSKLMQELGQRDEMIVILETRISLLCEQIKELSMKNTESVFIEEQQKYKESEIFYEQELCKCRSTCNMLTSKIELLTESESRLSHEIFSLRNMNEILIEQNSEFKNTAVIAQVTSEELEKNEQSLMESIIRLNNESHSHKHFEEELLSLHKTQIQILTKLGVSSQDEKNILETNLKRQLGVSEALRHEMESEFLKLREEALDISNAIHESSKEVIQLQNQNLQLTQEIKTLKSSLNIDSPTKDESVHEQLHNLNSSIDEVVNHTHKNLLPSTDYPITLFNFQNRMNSLESKFENQKKVFQGIKDFFNEVDTYNKTK